MTDIRLSFRFAINHMGALLVRNYPGKRYVLLVALAATTVAYVSSGEFPGLLAYGPLAPIITLLCVYQFTSGGGWLMSVAMFFPLYFAICSILSIALLLDLQHAWHVSAAIFVMLLLGNTYYFTGAWEAGIQVQGVGYSWLMLGLNVLIAAVAALLLFLSRRSPHRPQLLLSAHASNLLWLSWVAFPWLGELI